MKAAGSSWRRRRCSRKLRLHAKRLVVILSLFSTCAYFVCVEIAERGASNATQALESARRVAELPHLLRQISYEVVASPRFSACHHTSTKRLAVFVVVLSAAGASSIRSAIRQSWANANHSKSIRDGAAVVCFVVGMASDPSVMREVIAEGSTYGDLLLTSIREDYSNLTLKVYTAMEWKRANCDNAELLLKTDDDVIVNVDSVVRTFAHDTPLPMTIYGGRLWDAVEPRRSPTAKWYVPYERFDSKYFPTYASGPAYVIPRGTLEAIYEQLANTSWLTVEDAFYTGVVAEKARVHRVELPYFFVWERPPMSVPPRWPCNSEGTSRLAAIHGFKSTEEIVQYSTELQSVPCGLMPFLMERSVWTALVHLFGL